MMWRAAVLGKGSVESDNSGCRSDYRTDPPRAEGRRVLLHLKTGMTQDDNQMFVAFNVAQAAVEAGDQVEMFFDAAAVFDLQDAPSRGGEATSQPTSQPSQVLTP